MKKLKVCLHSPLSPEFVLSSDKEAFPASWSRDSTFHMGDVFRAFRQAKKGQCVLAVVVSLVTLIQNNQYTNMGHFGVACCEPYHQHRPQSVGLYNSQNLLFFQKS